jgi:hypothetical protein
LLHFGVSGCPRRRPEDAIEPILPGDVAQQKELGRKAVRWVRDHKTALRTANPTSPEKLINRNRDNWLPLLAIADEAGGHWPETARRVALLLSKEEDTTFLVMLLADIRAVFGEKDWLTSATLCTELNKLEDRPWCTIGRNEGLIEARKLARLAIYQFIRIRQSGGSERPDRRSLTMRRSPW